MKPNYDAQMNQIIETFKKTQRPKLLLHSCCGPCSSSVLQQLCQHFEVTVLFYNPNIMPQAEYAKRFAEQKKVIDILDFPVSILEIDYDVGYFLDKIKGLEKEPEGGARCQKCIELRLRKTAEIAAREKFDFFCTTLSVSPHKDVLFINEAGTKLAKEFGVSFLPSDFKKRNGYLNSTLFCKEHNIYRQNYCGCIFSKNEQSVVSNK